MKEYERKSLNIMKAFSNGLRYRIIKMLSEEKKLNVTEIANRIKRSKGRTSSHLRILHSADLVRFYTKGKEVFYLLKNPKVINIIKLSEELTKPKK